MRLRIAPSTPTRNSLSNAIGEIEFLLAGALVAGPTGYCG
jgi:hypothetical protein